MTTTTPKTFDERMTDRHPIWPHARQFLRSWLRVQSLLKDAHTEAARMVRLAEDGLFSDQPDEARLIEMVRGLRREIGQAGIEAADDHSMRLLATVLAPLVADDDDQQGDDDEQDDA